MRSTLEEGMAYWVSLEDRYGWPSRAAIYTSNGWDFGTYLKPLDAVKWFALIELGDPEDLVWTPFVIH
jgi:hypothetical protein